MRKKDWKKCGEMRKERKNERFIKMRRDTMEEEETRRRGDKIEV